MEDYVNLFWYSTRSQLPFYLWGPAYVLALVAEYPKTVLKIKIGLGLVDASSGVSSVLEVLKQLTDSPWYDILCIAVISGLATLYVHGTHLWIVIRFIRDKLRTCRNPELSSESSGSASAQPIESELL